MEPSEDEEEKQQHWLYQIKDRIDLEELSTGDKELTSSTSKLMYYVSCVNSIIPGIQLLVNGNVESLAKYANWLKHQEYETLDRRHELLSVAEIIPPQFFIEKQVFLELSKNLSSCLLGNKSAKLVEMKRLRDISDQYQNDEVQLQGRYYCVQRVLMLDSNWTNRHYHEPFRNLSSLPMNKDVFLAAPLETPRKFQGSPLSTGRPFVKPVNQEPERDSLLWYLFLTTLATIILTLMCVSFSNTGLTVTIGETQRHYNLWKVCVEGAGNEKCKNYDDVTDLGVSNPEVSNLLTPSRVLFCVYPAIGLVVVIVSGAKFWNRKTAKPTGRYIRAVVALIHFVWLLVTCTTVNRYFSKLGDSLQSQQQMSGESVNKSTTNGFGIILPWSSWLMSVFHTMVSIAWVIRFMFCVEPEIVPI